MKKTILNVSIILLFVSSGSSVFSQEMPKFSSDQEKQEWIKAHPAEYERLKTQNVEYQSVSTPQVIEQPATEVDLPNFPKYINTGNPSLDGENYKIAKAQWIAEHPDLYPNPVAPTIEAENQPSLEDLPGFPVLIDTGNPDADHSRYQDAKVAWYNENQEAVEEFKRTHAPKDTQQNKR